MENRLKLATYIYRKKIWLVVYYSPWFKLTNTKINRDICLPVRLLPMSQVKWACMQQGNKQPPMDMQHQTWARQIVTKQPKNCSSDFYNSFAFENTGLKKIDDPYAHGLYHTLFEQLGQSGSEKQNLLECQTYLSASDLKTSPNKWLLPTKLVGCHLPLRALRWLFVLLTSSTYKRMKGE